MQRKARFFTLFLTVMVIVGLSVAVAPSVSAAGRYTVDTSVSASADGVYKTLAEAISAAEGANTTISLKQDIVLSETLNIPGNITLTSLDPQNPCTIIRGAGFDGAFFAVSGDLRLQHIALDGNRTAQSARAALITVDGGRVTLDNGSVLKNNDNIADASGSALLVTGGGYATLNSGAAIIGCSAKQGGAVALGSVSGKGTLTVNGGEIIDSTAYGVYLENGELTMLGGRVESVTSDADIYAAGSSNVTLAGGAALGKLYIAEGGSLLIGSALENRFTLELSNMATGTVVAKPGPGYTVVSEDLDKLHIYGKILELKDGNVAVKGDGVELLYTGSVGIAAEDSVTLLGALLDTVIVPQKGWTLPESLTITVGGVELSDGVEYLYNSTTGALMLKAENVTADIVIKAVATLDWYDDVKDENTNREDLLALLAMEKATESDLESILRMQTLWGVLDQMPRDYIAAKQEPATTAQAIGEKLARLREQAEKDKAANEAAAAKFIEEHLTDENGNTILEANYDTFDKIVSSEPTWNGLNEAQKAAVDRILTQNNGGEPVSYTEMLEKAKQLKADDDRANTFIADHLTVKDSIIVSADNANLANIIGGESEWKLMTEGERAAVDRKLADIGGKPYKTLLADAKFLVKAGAKQELDDKANAITEAINSYVGLSDAEKSELIAAITDEVKSTKLAIDASDDVAEIGLIKTNSLAVLEVYGIYAARANEIKTEESLTDGEKQSLTELAASLRDRSLSALDAASDNAAIDLALFKSEASDEILKKYTDVCSVIAGMSGLTADDRTMLIADAGRVSDLAIENINVATAADYVSAAKQVGADALEFVTVKAAGVEKLSVMAQTAKDKLDAMSSLRDTERNELKAAVDAAVSAGKNIVAASNDTTVIDAAIANAKTEIDLILDRAEAMNSVFAAADAQNAEIDALANLNDNEKSELRAAVNEIAAEAVAAIKVSADRSAAEELRDTALAEIAFIGDLAEALETVAALTADETARAEGYLGLTESERAELVAELAALSQTAMNEIKAAANKDEITAAVRAGVAEIELVAARAAAKSEIVLAVADKKQGISELTGLTDGERTALNEAIDDISADAIWDIGVASDPAAVEAARAEAIRKLELTAARAAAMQKVAEAAKAEKARVDALTALSSDRKNYYKNAIDAAAESAKAKIMSDADVNAVAASRDAGIAEIEKLGDTAAAEDFVTEFISATDGKIYAKVDSTNVDKVLSGADAWKALPQSVKDIANEQIKEANKNNAGPSSYEKFTTTANDYVRSQANAFVKKYLTDKNGKLHTSASPENCEQIYGGKSEWASMSKAEQDEVNRLLEAAGGKKTYPELLTDALAVSKSHATGELDKNASSNKSEIDKLGGLSDAEKAALKAEIDAVTSAAKSEVTSSADPSAANKALEAAEKKIALIISKATAKNEIAEAEKSAEDCVNALDGLTDDQKAAYIAELKKLADEAKGRVDAIKYGDSDPSAKLATIVDNVKTLMNTEVDKAVAREFLNDYLTDEQGKLYARPSSENVDKILEGENVWSALTEAQRTAANELIAKENAEIKSYDDYLTAAEGYINDSTDKFVKDYLTASDGAIYTTADSDNYMQIFSGKDAWAAMSEAEKGRVNDILNKNGCEKTYPELAQDALNVAGNLARDEINADAAEKKNAIDALKNLSDDIKSIYKSEIDRLAITAKSLLTGETPEAVAKVVADEKELTQKVLDTAIEEDAETTNLWWLINVMVGVFSVELIAIAVLALVIFFKTRPPKKENEEEAV